MLPPMKTTIDFPEAVLHQAKIVAAQRKITLKDLVLQGLDHALRHPLGNEEEQRKEKGRKLLNALDAIQIEEPVGKFNREDAYDRHAGKWES